MIRFFFLELLLPLLLLLFARVIIRSVIAAFQSASAPPQKATRRSTPTVPAGGELKKDPVCGTYVSTAVSITRMVDGNPVYFCSKECRDRYRVA